MFLQHLVFAASLVLRRDKLDVAEQDLEGFVRRESAVPVLGKSFSPLSVYMI